MDLIRGVVFDKDGTLFDFRLTWEGWAYNFLNRLAGGETEKARLLGAAIGFDLHMRSFQRDSVAIAGTPAEIGAALAPFVDPAIDLDAMMTEEAEKAPLAEVVPLQPYLAGLKAAGLRLGVATNDAIEPTYAHLEAVGVRASFDFIAGYDSGHGGKPAPGQLLAFCASTGLAPECCVMVGDSLHDMRAGRSAGMRTIGVLTGTALTRELQPEADAVLPDISALPDWLAQINSSKPT